MRSFAVAGPVIWKSLPAALRTATLSPSTFARHLKTHLFGWSIVRLRTIYERLYKSTPHHHHTDRRGYGTSVLRTQCQWYSPCMCGVGFDDLIKGGLHCCNCLITQHQLRLPHWRRQLPHQVWKRVLTCQTPSTHVHSQLHSYGIELLCVGLFRFPYFYISVFIYVLY